MKAISLAACLLSAAAVAAPLSAQASVATAAEANAMRLALREAGVAMVFTDCTEDTSGVFAAKQRTLTICMNNVSSEADVDETVAHEAMHVAQWCAARRLGYGPTAFAPIHTFLSSGSPKYQKTAAEWLEWVNGQSSTHAKGIAFSSQYNRAGITNLIEREAYAMESDFKSVYGFVTAICGVGKGK